MVFQFDRGRSVDWGLTSADYAAHRPGPPSSFYEKLAMHGVGEPGRRVLDLGTGTGLLACEFARRGAIAAGLDLSEGQIAAAVKCAADDGLDIDFRVSGAEDIPFQDGTFDAVTANQCWVYFDLGCVLPELRRVMKPGGLLCVSYFSFLPKVDPIVRASEALVLKYNPDWSGGGWNGVIEPMPGWVHEQFEVRAMFWYDEEIPFSRESWRGRMRALRGMAAALSAEEVAAFDAEHDAVLRDMAGDAFTITHRISAHIVQFRE